MKVIVFSEKRWIRQAFPSSGRGKGANNLRFACWNDFHRLVPSLEEPALCYLDLSSVPEGRLSSALRLLARNSRLAYGLIDAEGCLPDPARAFHDGAVDYLTRAALRAGVDSRRLARVWAFFRRRRGEEAAQSAQSPPCRTAYLPCGPDWSQVHPGREYTFFLLFIELDRKEEMERKYGRRNLDLALSSFRSYIENSLKPCLGRIWLWSGFGGIALFPFNGRDAPAIRCLFRLVLFRHLYDIEQSRFPNFLSYRMALLLGNLVYTERNIGRVVSESLNAVFHMGRKFAQPGGLYVTEEAFRFAPAELKPFFLEAGEFEGRKVLRMRRPVHHKE